MNQPLVCWPLPSTSSRALPLTVSMLRRVRGSSGETTMEALDVLPGPRLGHAHWSIWLWLGLMIPKQLQLAGILGGVTQIMVIILPFYSDVPAAAASYFREADVFNQALWAVPLAVFVSLLVFQGYPLHLLVGESMVGKKGEMYALVNDGIAEENEA